MQCLPSCCNVLVSVRSTLHNGQQVSASVWMALTDMSSSFKGLSFLFLATKGKWDRQLAALFLYPGVCST